MPTEQSTGAVHLLQGATGEESILPGMEDKSFSLPNLAPYITFNPQVILFTTQPNSKRWVLQAITQSIREVFLG